MAETERKLETGSIYRRCGGGLCQIISMATQVETNEKVVVYQNLQGDYSVYVQRLENFIASVDKRQPEEKTTAPDDVKSVISGQSAVKADSNVNPDLLSFLDADTCYDKLKVLAEIRERIDDKMLNSIEASFDIAGGEGCIEDRIDYISSHLRTRSRYENNRLR